MPRILSRNCDETIPVCNNCVKKKRNCQHGSNLRWIVDATNYVDRIGTTTSQNQAIDPSPLKFSPRSVDFGLLAILEPKQALKHTLIADLFHHYVNYLAAWYDLNDAESLFASSVSLLALQNPVLFKALIAFAAIHKSKVSNGSLSDVAAAFHAACVGELIPLLERVDDALRGEFLAVTCLLRSYEILTGDTRSKQQHLLGAYSFVIHDIMDLSAWGLAQAGFWNYLREDITVALECRRPLHITIPLEGATPCLKRRTCEADSNIVSYILAKIINYCFQSCNEEPTHRSGNEVEWEKLDAELKKWMEKLPLSFETISTAYKPGNVFPSLWLLQPCHVAGMQYHAVAQILLLISKPHSSSSFDKLTKSNKTKRNCRTSNPSVTSPLNYLNDPETAEFHALRICGMAYTNSSVPARINAFGPMAFCGRYLRREEHRAGLRDMLNLFAEETGWNVEYILRDLEECWTAGGV